MQSLQNLFEDRIRMLRENEKAAKGSHEAEIQECRRLTDDLRHSYDQKQKQILETRQNLLQQKQARMVLLRPILIICYAFVVSFASRSTQTAAHYDC